MNVLFLNNKAALRCVWLFLFACMMVSANASDSTHVQGHLIFKHQHILAGSTVEFSYVVGRPVSVSQTACRAAVFYYAGKPYKLYAFDVDLIADGKNRWKGSVFIPDSLEAIAFRFTVEGQVDSNGNEGYVMPVYKSGRPKPGAQIAAARFHMYPEFGTGVPRNVRLASKYFEKEFTMYPQNHQAQDLQYYHLLILRDGKKATPRVLAHIHSLLKEPHPSYTQYEEAMWLYGNLGFNDKFDSLLQVTAGKFPNSEMGRYYYAIPFFKHAALQDQLANLANYRKQYSALVSDGVDTWRSAMYFTIARNYLEKKDFSMAAKYIDSGAVFSEWSDLLYARRDFIAALIREGTDTAMQAASTQLEICRSLLDSISNRPAIYRPAKVPYTEWSNELMTIHFAQEEDLRAQVLSRKGLHNEALATLQKVLQIVGEKDPMLNERYVIYLDQSGQTTTAMNKAAAYLSAGNGTATIRKYFREAYIRSHGGDAGIDSVLYSLEHVRIDSLRAAISIRRTRKPSPDFTLPDIDGKTISLAKLRGKVVVLDFWATWCAPCKASMPGMQQVLNNYQTDTNVVFLFVDTWERMQGRERTEKLHAFLAANGYGFRVLEDSIVNLEANKYLVVDRYGVEGIPTKFVVGPDGIIYYKEDDFDGNVENLVVSLSAMIEAAKHPESISR